MPPSRRSSATPDPPSARAPVPAGHRRHGRRTVIAIVPADLRAARPRSTSRLPPVAPPGPLVLQSVGGRSLLSRTLAALGALDEIDRIIVATRDPAVAAAALEWADGRVWVWRTDERRAARERTLACGMPSPVHGASGDPQRRSAASDDDNPEAVANAVRRGVLHDVWAWFDPCYPFRDVRRLRAALARLLSGAALEVRATRPDTAEAPAGASGACSQPRTGAERAGLSSFAIGWNAASDRLPRERTTRPALRYVLTPRELICVTLPAAGARAPRERRRAWASGGRRGTTGQVTTGRRARSRTHRRPRD